jgi:hypothetical protein
MPMGKGTAPMGKPVAFAEQHPGKNSGKSRWSLSAR